MAELTVEDIVEAGLNATYNAADVAGDAALNNNGDVMLHVKNADASSTTVTIAAQKASTSKDGFGTVSKANAVVAVPASGDRFIGPFPREAFNDAANKLVISYSSVTALTIAVLKVPAAG